MHEPSRSVALCFLTRQTQAVTQRVRNGIVVKALVRRLEPAWRRARSNDLTPAVLALSIAIGLSVGLLPLYGLHGVLVAALCLPFRLDAVLAFGATMISNPFTFPLLTWVEVHIGCLIVGGVCPDVEGLLRGEGVMHLGYQLLIGASITALLVGMLGATAIWLVANKLQSKRQAA